MNNVVIHSESPLLVMALVSCLKHALFHLNFIQIGIFFGQILRPLSSNRLNIKNSSTLRNILSILGVLVNSSDVISKG